MVEKDDSCPVYGSTLQSGMVISKPQPSVLHPFGETSSFEVLMSLKLKTFYYITSSYLSQHFIPMYLNYYVNQCESMKAMKFTSEFFLSLFDQSRTLKNSQMYIATLMTIDVHSTKPPCGILSFILWFFLQCCKGHASFCGCSQAKQGFHLWGAKVSFP